MAKISRVIARTSLPQSRKTFFRYACLFLSILGIAFYLLRPMVRIHASTGTGAIDDTNIVYIGRWDKTTYTTLYRGYWDGIYLKTNFTGTSVGINLGQSVNLYVSIDGQPDVFFSNANGTVTLASGLASGVHTLRVATRSESDVFRFEGLILDAGAQTLPPTVSNTILEFVGDSITSGYKSSENALTSYPWITASRMGTEVVNISQVGICLVDNVPCGWTMGQNTAFFQLQTALYTDSPLWDFSIYQSREVIINLGTNDNAYGVSDSTFQSVYTGFIQNIRSKYPNAEIFALRPFNGAKGSVIQTVVSGINAGGDAHVHFVDTTGWTTSTDFVDGLHLTDLGNVKVAQQLIPVIQPYLQSPTPTYTPSSTATNTPTLTFTPSATPTLIPTNTLPPTQTPLPTSTFTFTPTATFTPSLTYTPSATPTLTPTNTLPPTQTPLPTATNTPTVTYTPSATFTLTPSNTPLPTSTNTPTATFTPSLTYTPSATFTLTPSNTPLPTSTNTPTATFTPSLTYTPSATFTLTPSNTPLPTSTNTPTATFTLTPSVTPTLTFTNTPLPTSTFTATATTTPTLTYTPSATFTLIPSNTPLPTSTFTPTATYTSTFIPPTNTPLPTLTFTATATYTPTLTYTPSATPTLTPTNTLPPTQTLLPTSTFTFTPTPTSTLTATNTTTFTLTPTNTASPSATSTPTKTFTATSTSVPSGSPAPASFKLQYMTGNTANVTNELDPFVQIVNMTSSNVPLSQFKIRYWFTRDSLRPMAFGCAYAVINCSNISGTFTYLSTPVTNADVYAEVSFSAGAGNLAANGNTGDIELFLHNDIWSNFTQSNDYSFDAAKTAYADFTRITLYYNGALVWGTEPTGSSSPTSTPTFVPPTMGLTSTPVTATASPVPPTATTTPITFKLQYMTGNTANITNELDPFFQIVNTSSSSVPLSQFKIRYWFTRDSTRPMTFGCAYADVKCANIAGTFTYLATPVTNADTYTEISFSAAAGSIPAFGSSGQIQLFLHNDIWSNFTQNNDYSFDATKTAYADFTRVTLYNNGVLIWGTEPH